MALAFVATAILTIVYLLRVFVIVFMGPGNLSLSATDGSRRPETVVVEGSPLMVFSVALLALLSIISGIFIMPSFGFAEAAVQQMAGMIQ
jgi:NADH:ubiquinone oxidoreductase subunit 5 (subunit L)/multisubunit Na+/H+ antiporter MnhA subunit